MISEGLTVWLEHVPGNKGQILVLTFFLLYIIKIWFFWPVMRCGCISALHWYCMLHNRSNDLWLFVIKNTTILKPLSDIFVTANGKILNLVLYLTSNSGGSTFMIHLHTDTKWSLEDLFLLGPEYLPIHTMWLVFYHSFSLCISKLCYQLDFDWIYNKSYGTSWSSKSLQRGTNWYNQLKEPGNLKVDQT